MPEKSPPGSDSNRQTVEIKVMQVIEKYPIKKTASAPYIRKSCIKMQVLSPTGQPRDRCINPAQPERRR
jgi:hypothetical protein